jgi:hypothetical protein
MKHSRCHCLLGAALCLAVFHSSLTVFFGASTIVFSQLETGEGPGIGGAIDRIGTDGTGEQRLHLSENLHFPADIAFDPAGGLLYWITAGVGAVRSMLPNGTGFESFSVSGNSFSGSGIDGDFEEGILFYSDFGSGNPGAIYTSALDGSGLGTVNIAGLSNPTNLAVDPVNDHLYFSELIGDAADETSRIRRTDYDGSNSTVIVSGLLLPLGIDLDLVGGYLYWTDDRNPGGSDSTIERVELADLGNRDLIFQNTSANNIVFDSDENKIYWTTGGAVIQRTDVDNPVVAEDAVTGLTGPVAIALIPEPSRVLLVVLSFAAVMLRRRR